MDSSRYPAQHDAEEGILDAAVARVMARSAEGQPLSEVAEVARGPVSRSQPQKPTCWVTGGESRISEDRSTFGADTLEMDLTLQVDFADKDPVAGYRNARRLALMAGKELLRDDAGKQDQTFGGLRFVNKASFSRSGQPPPLGPAIQTHVVTYKVGFLAAK